MKRREFVRMGVLAAPSLAMAQAVPAQGKGGAVAAGADRLGETHSLGFSRIAFKTSGSETDGGLFVMEHANLQKGGPYRHVHAAQDEWLYAMEGEFVVELGEPGAQRVTLKPGDSLLMPRRVPHVWAQVGDAPGKLLIAFTPAGRVEEFFREFGKTGKMPVDAAVVKAYGLERLGPPLSL